MLAYPKLSLHFFFIARQVHFFLSLFQTGTFSLLFQTSMAIFFPEYIINSNVRQSLLMLLTLLEMSFPLAFAHHNLIVSPGNNSMVAYTEPLNHNERFYKTLPIFIIKLIIALYFNALTSISQTFISFLIPNTEQSI